MFLIIHATHLIIDKQKVIFICKCMAAKSENLFKPIAQILSSEWIIYMFIKY